MAGGSTWRRSPPGSTVAPSTPGCRRRRRATRSAPRRLLEAAAGNRLVEGSGTMEMQLAAAGATVVAMKRAVDGKASLALVNGAVRGIDLGERIRQARELLGRGESEQAASDATKKTDFSSMSISFTIADGIASSSDLDMKSPLLRVGGE